MAHVQGAGYDSYSYHRYPGDDPRAAYSVITTREVETDDDFNAIAGESARAITTFLPFLEGSIFFFFTLRLKGILTFSRAKNLSLRAEVNHPFEILETRMRPGIGENHPGTCRASVFIVRTQHSGAGGIDQSYARSMAIHLLLPLAIATILHQNRRAMPAD